jgi:hemoglobin-like flavoprotein
MKAIGAAVSGLEDVEGLRPVLQDLGRRYLSQGVKPGDYVTLGKALLWTFEQSLAENFTPAVKDAWAALYALLSSGMLQGAEVRETYKPRERTQLAM